MSSWKKNAITPVKPEYGALPFRISRLAILLGVFTACAPAVVAQDRYDQMDPISKMVLLPIEAEFARPSDLDMDADEVFFPNPGGQILRGWFVRAKNATHTILVCNGNAGNASILLPYAKLLVDEGFNVFMFEYQGFGKSEGVPSVTSLVGDTQAAWDFLIDERKVDREKVGVFGISLGSVLGLALSAREQPAAVVLEGMFVPNDHVRGFERQVKDNAVAKFLLGSLKKTLLEGMDPVENVAKLNCPVFLMHGQYDYLLKASGSVRVWQSAQAANVPSRLWIMCQCGHAPETLEIHDREYAYQLQSFFRDAFADKIDTDRKDVTWKSNPITDSDGTRQYEVEINVESDSRRPVELCISNESVNQFSIHRVVCEPKDSFSFSVYFEPTLVTAVTCKHVVEDGEGKWKCDLSQMSHDRFQFMNLSSRLNREWREFVKTNELEAKANRWRFYPRGIVPFESVIDHRVWSVVAPNLPEAQSVHPHIRPQYCRLIAAIAQSMPDATPDELMPIWECCLEYLPERPAAHYELGDAWFTLGLYDENLGAMLKRWARHEITTGNTPRAHELLQTHLQVSEPEHTPLRQSDIKKIATLEDFEKAFATEK